MRIAWDAKRLFLNKTGLGVYSRSLLAGFISNNSSENLLLYTPKINPSIFNDHLPNKIEIVQPNFIFSKIKSVWRSLGLGILAKKQQVDIYHGLCGEIPPFLGKNCKKVVTIHDLLFIRFPEDYSFWDRKIHELKSNYACHKADKILAVSQATKDDIIQFYKISPDKIVVVPVPFSYMSAAEKPTLDLPKKYILSVGSPLPRKNLSLLIKAYAHWKKNEKVELIIVCNKSKKYFSKLEKLVRKFSLEKKVLFLENLSNSDLKHLYSNALFSVYPSLYEGFGIPILESISMNCPIVCSNFNSAMEINEKLPVFFDNGNLDSLIEKMNYTYTNRKQLKENIENQKFSVLEPFKAENIAKKVLNIYKSL